MATEPDLSVNVSAYIAKLTSNLASLGRAKLASYEFQQWDQEYIHLFF